MNNRKIFLTGEKGSGKSTLIKRIVKECQLSTSGFQTLPFYEKTQRTGFYLHSLVKLDTQDQMFSIQHPTYNEVIPGVFDTFGVQILEQSRKQQDDILILDEIGHLEQKEIQYLEALQQCIEECKNIFGVLKKCEIQYIQDIKKRKDTIIFDLDEEEYEEIYQALIQIWKE